MQMYLYLRKKGVEGMGEATKFASYFRDENAYFKDANSIPKKTIQIHSSQMHHTIRLDTSL